MRSLAYHADEILDLKRKAPSVTWVIDLATVAASVRLVRIAAARHYPSTTNKARCSASAVRKVQKKSTRTRSLRGEEEMLAKVELPYRVIDTAGTWALAARKFDREAWLPTRERYMEADPRIARLSRHVVLAL